MKEYKLVCSVCGRPFSGKDEYLCSCGGQLEPYFDLKANAEEYRDIIRNGCVNGVWDYKKMLPVGDERPVTLGEGATPLLDADKLADLIGVKSLYLKNETLNPSGTYKDRFATVALTIEKAKNTPAVALGSARQCGKRRCGLRGKGRASLLCPSASRRRRGARLADQGIRCKAHPYGAYH